MTGGSPLFFVCYPCNISAYLSVFYNEKSVQCEMAHFRNCYFHFANLICGKAAVDGYFILPRYTSGQVESLPEMEQIHSILSRKKENERIFLLHMLQRMAEEMDKL